MQKKILLTGLSLIIWHHALADGSINVLDDIVYTAIAITIGSLIILASFVSLFLNFLIFKGEKQLLETAIGAFIFGSIPLIFHGFGDYTIILFIIVFIFSVLGGLLGHILIMKIKETNKTKLH